MSGGEVQSAETGEPKYHVFRRWQAIPNGYTWPQEYGPWHLIESTRGTSDLAVCGVFARTWRGARISEERPADHLCRKCKAHSDRTSSSGQERDQ